MKAKYIKPAITVESIEIETCLMTASLNLGEGTTGRNGITSGDAKERDFDEDIYDPWEEGIW